MIALMKNPDTVNKKYVLTIYIIAFYVIWTVWEFFAKPFISGNIENEYAAQLIKSGIIKNLVWTVPAILLIKHFENYTYAGLKEMFTPKLSLLKYIPVFLAFTVWLFAGAYLAKGKIALNESFGLNNLIVVLFVGVTEETVFRGWLLNFTLGKRVWPPLIVNSVMFLLIHFPIWIYEGTFIGNFQNLGFLSPVLLSVIFGLIFIKTKNLLLPVLLHMYWDLIIFMLY